MNKIRAIQQLNKREIEQGITPEASWHTDYRDTAFIYFGGLPYELSEGDVITIFSQFGEPVFLKLVRDKETGKSKGFGWLQYADQRSTDLAVDNLGGADVGGRLISVDHARYKPRDDEDPDEFKVGWEDMKRKEEVQSDSLEEDSSREEVEERPALREEDELRALIRHHDDDDPMKAYLIEEKKKELDDARRKAERKGRRHRHDRHHRSRRHHREDSAEVGHPERRRGETAEARQRRSSRDESRRHPMDAEPVGESGRLKTWAGSRGDDFSRLDSTRDHHSRMGHSRDERHVVRRRHSPDASYRRRRYSSAGDEDDDDKTSGRRRSRSPRRRRN